jgi:hypothetical protein
MPYCRLYNSYVECLAVHAPSRNLRLGGLPSPSAWRHRPGTLSQRADHARAISLRVMHKEHGQGFSLPLFGRVCRSREPRPLMCRMLPCYTVDTIQVSLRRRLRRIYTLLYQYPYTYSNSPHVSFRVRENACSLCFCGLSMQMYWCARDGTDGPLQKNSSSLVAVRYPIAHQHLNLDLDILCPATTAVAAWIVGRSWRRSRTS